MRSAFLGVAILCAVSGAVDVHTQSAQPPSRPGPAVGAPVPGPGLPARDTAQKPATGTAIIRGRVTASPSATPLRRVRMMLQTPAGPEFTRVAMTDAQGRYEFRDLPAGRYSLSASKPAYVGLQYGQRRPYESGTGIVLRDRETLTGVDMALPRGSVIVGRITDEFNEPMTQAEVQAQRSVYTPDGQRRLAVAGSATTDDRGEFRIYGLMPGEYVVSGSVRNSPPPFFVPGSSPAADLNDGYPPTFYPGTSNSADARPVSLGLGEEASVQFGLVAARFARISGTARRSDGQPAYPAEVMVLPRMSPGTFFLGSGGSMSNRTAPDGSFSVSGVAPGEYTIDVRPQRGPQPLGREAAAESGSAAVTVTGNDITGVRITTSKGAVVSGRVVWEGSAPRQNPLQPGPPKVSASPIDSLASSLFGFVDDPAADGSLDDDGRFRLGGVKGRFHLDVSTSPNWRRKSVAVDGRDVTEQALDLGGRPSLDGIVITMTDRLTTVSGVVLDTRGAAVRDYVVVILPADERDSNREFWYEQMSTPRPDTDGRFETRGLKPGRYVAAAIETLEQGRQFSPEFQRQLRSRAPREFTIREGEALALELRLTPGL